LLTLASEPFALQKPRRVVGDDTVSAMQSGIFWSHVALIEGMIARIKAERNEAMAVVATGGVASLFHGATTAIDHFDPDLTIRGLLEVYRRNAGTPSDKLDWFLRTNSGNSLCAEFKALNDISLLTA
jgi:pantothenate kinase type III